jgi:hypothetical protein
MSPTSRTTNRSGGRELRPALFVGWAVAGVRLRSRPSRGSPAQISPSAHQRLPGLRTAGAHHIRRCSSDSSLVASLLLTCRVYQKLGWRVVHRPAGATSQPAKSAQRPRRSDADHSRRTRSIGSLLLSSWPSCADRRQRPAHAHRRRSYFDLHLRLRQVRRGYVLDRATQRGEPHLRGLEPATLGVDH